VAPQQEHPPEVVNEQHSRGAARQGVLGVAGRNWVARWKCHDSFSRQCY
jgi:hypothetical protein